MPLYEYQCEKCEETFEFLAKNSEEKPGKCPNCGSKKTRKLLSTFSASVPSGGGSSCDLGSCSTGTCSTGTCPYSS
ncbi:MAG: zinc ribbon domain-containing protein [Spartobacteria bacterium]|nr:zinc ribbon domain-containing protein [Spartobacteria bacterium]